MLVIKDGYGYWDVTRYPRGGDFRRAVGNVEVKEYLGEYNHFEARVLLADGSKAVVKKEYLEQVNS